MARSPFNRGILDYLPDPLNQQQPFQQGYLTDSAVANANTATRNDPESPWGTLRDGYQPQGGPDWMTAGNTAAPDWGGMAYAKAAGDPTANAANAVTTGLQPKGPPAPTNVKAPDGRFLDQYGNPFGPAPTVTPPPQGTPTSGTNPQGRPATTPGQHGDGSLFSTPDVEGSFGSRWDGTRWVDNPNGVPAGSAIGKTGATLPVAYNASLDRFRHEFNGQAAESSRSRVARWAGDAMRERGMDAQSAYNAALARLKRDMGPNWQQSGFDLTNIQAAPVGNDYYVPQVAVPGQTTPPGTPPPTTTPPGTQPPATTTTPPLTYKDPLSGKEQTITGGDAGFNQRNMALFSDPDFALNQMMEQIGLAPGSNNAFANSIRNTLKPQLARFMQLQGLGDGQRNVMDSQQASLSDFTNRVNGGAGLFEGLNQFANQQKQLAFTPGSKFMQGDYDTQMAALSQLTALGTAGMNPLMQAAWKQYFDNAAYASKSANYDQLGPNNSNQSAADWLRNSQWADLLR